MTNFSSNWIKDKKVNTPDRIKGAVRTPQPLKPKIELAKNKIQIQNHKLDTILDKLKGKEKSLFNQVVAHMQIHDMQQGKMLSNELAQVRKTTKMISQLKMALEQIHMRLESTIDIGDVMVAIGPAMGALTRVKSGLSGVMPEVDTELGEINGVFSDIITNAGNMGNASLALDASGEDVDKILAEASAVAEQRMNDNFPDIPLGSFNSDSRSAVDEHSQ
ncbi:MAG TPA: Snf7 family protein [Candidatus Nitrosopolaris sp.]|jgi:division protein CdvB (Snf7/Vps24/ESCRT-III family)